MRYIVKDREGKIIQRGDRVTDFRGKEGTFESVSGIGATGTPKVIVNGFQYYARVFGLTVEVSDDEEEEA